MIIDKTHYESLRVSEIASQGDIEKAHQFLIAKWSPDRNPNRRETAEQISKSVNEAYAVLSDPDRRREYDELIKKQREAASITQPPLPAIPIDYNAKYQEKYRDQKDTGMPWTVLLWIFIFSITLIIMYPSPAVMNSDMAYRIAGIFGGAVGLVIVPWIVASVIAAPSRLRDFAWPSYYQVILVVGWMLMAYMYFIGVTHAD